MTMSRSDQRQDAGDNATLIQAGGPIVIHNHSGITEERARQIVWETFRQNALALAGEARSKFEGRGREFIDGLIVKLLQSSPSGLNCFADPGMLSAVFNAQKSYAETGDSALGDLLADLLVELSAEEEAERTSRHVILRQALN